MLETLFPFFTSKKPSEILIFGTFQLKTKKQKNKKQNKTKINFGLYFPENRHFQVGHALLRHCDVVLIDFHDFVINRKRRPNPLPWYQTTILWAVNFNITRGW